MLETAGALMGVRRRRWSQMRWWWGGAFGCAVGWGAGRPWPGSPCCRRGGTLPSQRCAVAMFCFFFWLLTLNLQDGTLALCGTSWSCRCLRSVALGRGTVELGRVVAGGAPVGRKLATGGRWCAAPRGSGRAAGSRRGAKPHPGQSSCLNFTKTIRG